VETIMTTTLPRTRLRATIATIGGLALAASLVAVTPAAAASPTACRVKNLDTGITKYSLQKAHDAAKKGHRLTVRGVCAGPTTIRKSLTITGVRTKSSGTPILDGKLNGMVVTVSGPHWSTIKVTMKSLTVRYGATSWIGGGILNDEGNLVLRDVVVRGNTADSGGGIASINGGTLTLNGSSSIRGNHSEDTGGGVVSSGTFILNGSSSIKGNTAGSGGGVSLWQGTFKMNGTSSVQGNTASQNGGGVVSHGTFVLNSSSRIEGNTALFAGGVYNFGTLVMKDSSSIKANTADSYAGGVVNSGLLRMRDFSTITGNSTHPDSVGGGVWTGDGGTFDGVRCPMPGVKANVRNNTPDDCYSVPVNIQ
jgi:hypothetical protein